MKLKNYPRRTLRITVIAAILATATIFCIRRQGMGAAKVERQDAKPV